MGGVRLILKHLVKRFRALGGKLKLRSGVARIHVEDNRAVAIELEDGQIITAKNILSSAGVVETLRLCDDSSTESTVQAGEMSFIESISVTNKQPKEFGFEETIVFFNDTPDFHWRKPADSLCDVRTGVICSPNNYEYSDQNLGENEGFIRLTTIANHRLWESLPEHEYARNKLRWYDESVASAIKYMPDFRRHVVDVDVFTPKTIRRFTSHDNGAVY